MKVVKIKPAKHIIKWFLQSSGYKAVTSVWNTIYVLPEYITPEYDWLIRHEMCHIEQINRIGKLKFLYLYFKYNIKYGYWDNPFEIEARSREKL